MKEAITQKERRFIADLLFQAAEDRFADARRTSHGGARAANAERGTEYLNLAERVESGATFELAEPCDDLVPSWCA